MDALEVNLILRHIQQGEGEVEQALGKIHRFIERLEETSTNRSF